MVCKHVPCIRATTKQGGMLPGHKLCLCPLECEMGSDLVNGDTAAVFSGSEGRLAREKSKQAVRQRARLASQAGREVSGWNVPLPSAMGTPCLTLGGSVYL